MQYQVDNFSREMGTIRKNQMEMIGMKNTVTEIKNTFKVSSADSTQPRKESDRRASETYQTMSNGLTHM